MIDSWQDGLLERRLLWSNIDRLGALELLEQSQLGPPGDSWWWAELQAMRHDCQEWADGEDNDAAWLAAIETSLDTAPQLVIDLPFVHLLIPIARRARNELRRRVLARDSSELFRSVEEALFATLLCRLSQLLSPGLGSQFVGSRSLVDVIHARVDRTRSTNGPPRYEREGYANFCRSELSSGLTGLLGEYPVLGRLIVVTVSQAVDMFEDLQRRVKADRALLHQRFGVHPHFDLSSIEVDLGDRHRGGRSVCGLTFSGADGAQVSVIYKPRSVMVESQYQETVALVGSIIGDTRWRGLAVAALSDVGSVEKTGSRPTNGDYGYVERVKYIQARDADEREGYFRNCGRLLAILYALGATDCHFENVIACGTQPHLIDSETILNGKVASFADSDESFSVSELLAESVLKTGFLPSWSQIGHNPSCIDVSALGVKTDHVEPEAREGWCYVNTDDMVWGTKENSPRRVTSLPFDTGKSSIEVSDIPALQLGFEEVYELLVRHRNRRKMLAIVDRMASARRRVVVRSTRVYSLVQHQALSLAALRDPNQRACALETLAKALLVADQRPEAWDLLSDEFSALEELDVPCFESPPKSLDLELADGRVVKDFFQKSGTDVARERLKHLSLNDCNWQTRLIAASVALRCHTPKAPIDVSTPNPMIQEPSANFRSNALEAASQIASSLLDSVVYDNGSPTWLVAASFAGGDHFQLGLLPPGLYDGAAGLAVFLGSAARSLPSPETAEAAWRLCDQVLQPVLELVDCDDADLRFRHLSRMGTGFAGIGGLLRACEYLDSRQLGPDRTDTSIRLAMSIDQSRVVGDLSIDVIDGTAGLVTPLVSLFRRTGHRGVLALIQACGRRLAESQDPRTGGWATLHSQRPLTGWSHGSSGILASLVKAATTIGNEDWIDRALRALAFEQNSYDADEGNWIDWRGVDSSAPRFSNSWCHGAPGVALSRLTLLSELPNHPAREDWREDLATAAEATAQLCEGGYDHLCCGSLGRAAILMLLADTFENPAWRSAGLKITEGSVKRASDRGGFDISIRCDSTGAVSYPGLMQGLAGVGMHLMNLDSPGWVRGILL